jgi:hypothetical protein
MDALWKLFIEVCDGDVAKFKKLIGTLEVECESKPCCRRCSAILGLLDAKAATNKTKKSTKNMGSTEWTLAPDLRKLLTDLLGEPDLVWSSFGSQ